MRIYYEDDDGIHTLTFLGTDAAREHPHATAVAQFLSAFSEHAEGESLTKGELADDLGRWHQNLTGNSIGPLSIGWFLQRLGVETTDQAVSNRRWVDRESMD